MTTTTPNTAGSTNSSGHLIMILHGAALSVPPTSNIHTIANTLIHQELGTVVQQQGNGNSSVPGTAR